MKLSEKAIRKVAAQIFETMLFMFSEEAEAPPQDQSHVKRATIEYTGPFKGKVILRVPDAIVTNLTVSMLGAEDDYTPTPEEELDMLGEMANVLSGNVLNAITNDETVFGLRAPVTRAEDGSEDKIESDEKNKSVYFNFEEGWAELIVCVYPD